MAVDQASYRVTRHTTIYKVVRWALNKLNLRNWEVGIYYGDLKPGWADQEGSDPAQSRTFPGYFRADIWISPAACKDNDYSPVSVAIHEVLHIYFYHYRYYKHDERMVNIIESLLYKLWLAENPPRQKSKPKSTRRR